MLFQDYVSELTIRNVTHAESGAVAVAVRNGAGEAGSQGFLLVQGKYTGRVFQPE